MGPTIPTSLSAANTVADNYTNTVDESYYKKYTIILVSSSAIDLYRYHMILTWFSDMV